VSPAQLLFLAIGIPLGGAGFVLALPAADRLTLRGVGVVTGLLALGAGVALTAAGGVTVVLPGTRVELAWAGAAVPAALALLGVTPLALRAGAPRVERGVTAYVVATLLAEAVTLLGLLATDVRVAVAVAVVAAVPVFALVALFGGPLRGSVTYRAAGLWILVDMTAVAALALGPPHGNALLVLAALGPGLVRLGAGPWGLWALPVLEQAPVTAACLVAGAVGPTGLVLLQRAVAVVGADIDVVRSGLTIVLAIAGAIGAALVVTERDLRRLVGHMLGVLGAFAAVGVLGGRMGASLALVVVAGFAGSFALIVVEALERRLETRRIPELAGVLAGAPLLGVLLPLSLATLAGWPVLGVGVVGWSLAADLVAAPDVAVGAAGLVFGVGLAVASVVVVVVVARLALPQRRRGQDVRVSFLQGIRLLLPLGAVVVVSVFAGVVAVAP
jgi:formate hydrogenlyase subunit 3/multisubunit Na+/H+ antiporter MnhD subunit